MSGEELRAMWRGYTPELLGRQNNYAVLCPFVECSDGLHLLFEVRAATLRRQPGEVCFPGGRMEQGETAEQCALRETAEELAIPCADIQVFGQSDFLCLPGKFLLQPVLGLVDAKGMEAMHPSLGEVQETFTVPLDFFQNNPPQVFEYVLKPDVSPNFPYNEVGIPETYFWGRGLVEVPIWHWRGHTIWGMSGRIVKNLMETMDRF